MACASNAPQKSHSYFVVGLYIVSFYPGQCSPQDGVISVTGLEGKAREMVQIFWNYYS
jgi:hypothetical protein